MLAQTHAAQVSPWTAIRTTRLVEMWSNGFSAQEIADLLGHEITRNAVIGRAHRLKLSRNIDRKFWSETDTETLRTMWAEGHSAVSIAIAVTSQGPKAVTRGAVINKAIHMGLPARPKHFKKPRVASQPRAPRSEVPLITASEDLAIPFEQRKTIETIGMHDCRWPVGDPATPEFFFCGAAITSRGPYCAGHCKRAYGYVNEGHRRPFTAVAKYVGLERTPSVVEEAA